MTNYKEKRRKAPQDKRSHFVGFYTNPRAAVFLKNTVGPNGSTSSYMHNLLLEKIKQEKARDRS